MPAGYEDQLPGATEQDRLRDAFAQMLAAGQDRSRPLEDLWAAQGRSQLPDPRQVQRWDLPIGGAGDFAAMPQQSVNPPGLNFPQAPAGPAMQNIRPPPNMPPVPDAPPSAPPFHGRGEVVGPYDPRQPAAPLPPDGGFADTVSPTRPPPDAGASNRAIQPGGATKSAYHLPTNEKKKKAKG